MITVHYCEEVLFDLPPPTLLYMGNSEGFRVLAAAIAEMLHYRKELCVNYFPGVTVNGTDKQLLFRPFDHQTVSLVTNNSIVTDVSEADWQEIAQQLRSLAEASGSQTYFLELGGYIDQVNVVFES